MMSANHILKFKFFILLIVAGFSCKVFLTKREYKYAKIPISSEQYDTYVKNLDSSYVFYREWVMSSNIDEKPIKIYAVIRFLPDGRCQTADFKSIPNLQEIQKMFSNYSDYYKIEKGLLMLEIYRGELASMGYWEGKIYSDSLVFHKVGNNKVKYPQVYYKVRVP